ncbi:MAG: hypothetical protein AAF649_11100 [Verrucomicrobiota bacterium]
MKKYTLIPLITVALACFGCSEKSTHQIDKTATGSSTLPAGSSLLETEFPEPVMIGTPPDPIKISNLQAAPKTPPVLRVPAGTTLLSSGKPVTASDDFPLIGDLSYVTDGDKDGGDGYFVELFNGLQWIQIDLEQEALLAGIWVWHYHGYPRAYHDVIIQVSNDPEFATGVTTLFNNDYDKSAGLGKGRNKPYVESIYGKLVDARGTSARYVRLYSNGNTGNELNHYIEVEVYGSAR